MAETGLEELGMSRVHGSASSSTIEEDGTVEPSLVSIASCGKKKGSEYFIVGVVFTKTQCFQPGEWCCFERMDGATYYLAASEYGWLDSRRSGHVHGQLIDDPREANMTGHVQRATGV